MLKGSVERERQEVKELDGRINEHEKRQQILNEELISLDHVLSKRESTDDIEVHGLRVEIEELRRENSRIKTEKE